MEYVKAALRAATAAARALTSLVLLKPMRCSLTLLMAPMISGVCVCERR